MPVDDIDVLGHVPPLARFPLWLELLMNIVEKVASSTGCVGFEDSQRRRSDRKGHATSELRADLNSGVDVQPWPPPSILTQNAIRDTVVANGRKYGVEFLVAVNERGQLIESAKGSQFEVKFSKKLQDALSDPDSRVIAHHNHPRGSPLSRKDLALLAYRGLKVIFAHTSNPGAVYTSHATLSEYGRDLIDRYVGHVGVDVAFSMLDAALMECFAFDRDIQRQIWQGSVNIEEANLCKKLALFEAAHRSGLLITGNNFSIPPLFYRKDIQKGINRMASDVNKFFEWSISRYERSSIARRQSAVAQQLPSEEGA